MRKRTVWAAALAAVLALSSLPVPSRAFDFSSGEDFPAEPADDAGVPFEEVPAQEIPYVPEEPQQQVPVEDDLGFTSDFSSSVEQPPVQEQPQVVVQEQPQVIEQPQVVVQEQPQIVEQPQGQIQPAVVQQVIFETPTPTPTPVPVTTTEATTEATTELPEEKASLSAEEIQEMNQDQAVLVYQGQSLVFVGGTLAYRPVLEEEAAKQTALRVRDLLGMAPQTSLLYRDVSLDVLGNVTWRFAQMLDTIPVEDGEVLVFTDAQGRVTGLASSVASSFSAEEATAVREDVELTVKRRLKKAGAEPVLYTDYTRQVLLSDPAEDPFGPAAMVWVVYSDNPEREAEGGDPFLAHYLSGEGKYLYSVPCALPGNPSSLEAYDIDEFFEGLSLETYSQELTDRAGNVIQVSVPMLYDPLREAYYLADPGRQLAMAERTPEEETDFAFLSAPDQDGFTAADLLTYQAFLSAYDFFEGITGMRDDSENLGVLILKDEKDVQGNPLPGVSYLGFQNGWQMFSANSADGMATAQDLVGAAVAEEVLSSRTPALVKVNGAGRVREALQDIFGNLMEQILDTHVDVDWEIGETTGAPLRSLSNPNAYLRPSFTGDAFYLPETDRPSLLTRYGGVREDSSLLSLVAFLGCEAGMTPQEARALWGKVAFSLTAKSGEGVLQELVPWAARQLGLGVYEQALREAISSVRLGAKVYQPQRAKEGYSLVQFTPPVTQLFLDSQSVLTLTGAEPSLEGVALESWSTEGGNIVFMAPPGEYEIRLWVPDAASEGVLCYAYEEGAWRLTAAGEEISPVTLPEDESLTLKTEGLSGAEDDMADLRLELLLAVEDDGEWETEEGETE